MGYDPPSPMAYAPPSPADDLTISPISSTTGRGRRRNGLPRSYRVDYSAPGSPGVGFEFVVGRRGGGSLERGREREQYVKGASSGGEEDEEERGRTSRSRGPPLSLSIPIPGRTTTSHAPDRKPIPMPIPKRKFADAVSMAFFEDGRLRGRRKRGKSVGVGAGAGAGGVGVGVGEEGEHAFVLDISLEGEAGVGSSSGGEQKKKKGKAAQRERTESASGSSSAFSLDDDDDDDVDAGEGQEKTAGSTTPFMWVSRSKPAARYQSTPIIPIPVPLPSNKHRGFVMQDEEEWEGEVPNNLSCGLTLLAGPSSLLCMGRRGGGGGRRVRGVFRWLRLVLGPVRLRYLGRGRGSGRVFMRSERGVSGREVVIYWVVTFFYAVFLLLGCFWGLIERLLFSLEFWISLRGIFFFWVVSEFSCPLPQALYFCSSCPCRITHYIFWYALLCSVCPFCITALNFELTE
jgi:hypothetical protein